MSDIEMRFVAPPKSIAVLPDGSRVIFDAVITAPKRWAGQKRDLIVYADGSVHLGRNRR